MELANGGNMKRRNFIVSLIISAVFLFSIVSSASLFNPRIALANNNQHLLDRVIQWNDGTSEHIQIDSEGFFILDGTKRRLVGMCLSTTFMPYGDSGEFYLPENMAVYEEELSYLESIGVRIIHIELRYIRWWLPNGSLSKEEAAYRSLLDLLYQHKMLVIPMLAAKAMPNYGNLTETNFSWDVWAGTGMTKDSIGSWAERWSRIVGEYSNVVGVVAENEIDYPLPAAELGHLENPQSQQYTGNEVKNYMEYVVNIIKSKVDAPVVSKLIAYRWTSPDIKLASLETTDLAGYTCYSPTTEQLVPQLNELLSWIGDEGHQTEGWWCLELNSGYPPIYLDNFSSTYIQSVFDQGASIAMLWPANWSLDTTWQLFDENGIPHPKLVEIGQEINSLQKTL
jgi:hypothetical protein